MIAPVIPPQTPLQQLIHGTHTLPPLPAPAPDADLVVGMSTVGRGGRVVDRKVFAALGWEAGDRLMLRRAEHGILLASADPEGPILMRDGTIHIPLRQRRRVQLVIGDRALLLGRHTLGRLAIVAPAAMETVFAPGLALLER
ncbi:hypothetical protein FHY52_04375 [Nocardia nova]|uniref:hypothetical protein n=1 Tax=Nocardia nova TaxID=37330 RepID=UPI0025B219C8|nr:hypothetical protein [Nocardia nova]MDN2495935.1 hypothetical protein [Nocardia nova]